jgi:hypothetical protein
MPIQFKKLHPGRIVYEIIPTTGRVKSTYDFYVYPIKIVQRDDFNRRVLVEDHRWDHVWVPEAQAIRWSQQPPKTAIFYRVGKK